MHQQMVKRQIPGLALTIVRGGKEIKTAAYGFANLELKAKTKPETVFEIGSVTKQFTAAGILLLAQDGDLTVDDKIAKFLPETPLAWTNITIRHLLTHTSGIKNYTGLNGFELTKHLTRQRFIEKLAPLPMDFEPGEKWKYCNSGYNLLGFIIEKVSGKKYWDFMGARVFGPLGMTSTTSRDPARIVPNRADGYELQNSVLANRDYDLTDIFSAGEIVSTVGNLARWNSALHSDRLLLASSKEQMWTSGTLNDGKMHGYGFGWRVEPFEGHKNIGHSGSTSGFSASLQRFPQDGIDVILLCNSGEEGVATRLARQIAAFYFKPKKEESR
ncbi:MAG: serine hydrolase domain-containing protein [Verrucomicrobiota bacterium]